MSIAMIWQTVSTSSADTEKLGELLGIRLKPPATLELLGDLGAGKTTLVRGLARGCGSSAQVASPSFTLARIYECKDDVKLHHLDLYRLNDEPGVIAEQLAEISSDPKAIVVVEWGTAIKNILPADVIKIELSVNTDDTNLRRIKIEYPENRTEMIKGLENSWRDGQP